MGDITAQVLAQQVPANAPNPTWSTLGALPATRYGAAVSTDGTNVYVSHGFTTAAVATGLSVTTAGVSTATPNATTARAYVAGVFAGGRHWAIGGGNGSTAYATVEAYTPSGTNGAAGTWATATSLTGARAGAAAAAVGNYIYVAGGSGFASASAPTAANATGSVMRYDTTAGTSGTWTTLTNAMPAARFGGALVAVGTKLFYLGGFDNTGTGTLTVYVYDTAGGTGGTWSAAGTLSASLSSQGPVAVGATVWWQRNDGFYYFDTTTGKGGSFTPKPAVSHSGWYSHVAIGSTVYVVSGTGTPNVDVIDTNAITLTTAPGWNTLAALPATRYGAATSTDGTNAYVTHGFTTVAVNSGVTITPAGTVTPITATGTITTSRSGAAGAFYAGQHYVLGGNGSAGIVGTVNSYTPSVGDGSAGTWATAATLPSARMYASAAAVGGFLYVAGGQITTATSSADAGFFRFNGTAWTNLTATAPLPAARTQGAMFALSGKLYYTGGYDTAGAASAVTYVYDPALGTWATSAPNPTTIIKSPVAVIDGKAYQSNGSDDLRVFDGTAWTRTTMSYPSTHGGDSGLVGIGSVLFLVSGASTPNVDTLDTAAVAAGTPFARRVRTLQQYLAGSDPTGFALSRRLLLTVPAQATWTTIGALSAARSASAVSTDGTYIYVLGGNQAGTAMGYVTTINAATGAGATTDTQGVISGVYGGAGAWFNGRALVVGGFNGSAVGTRVSAYTPGANGAAGTASNTTALPAATMYASAAVLGSFLYVAGGQSSTATTSAQATFYRFDGTTWTTLTAAPLPAARTQGAMVSYSGRLYYIGGLDTAGNAGTSIFVYDPVVGTWSTLVAPNTWGGITAAILAARVYIIAGVVVSVYDIPTNTQTATVAFTVSHQFGGVAAVGSNVFAVSGTGTANVDKIDPVSATNYVRDVRTLRAVLTA